MNVIVNIPTTVTQITVVDTDTHVNMDADVNKAVYTAGQSRTVGQEQQCRNRSQFRNVTGGPTDRLTDTARCRLACPRLKTKKTKGKKRRELVIGIK